MIERRFYPTPGFCCCTNSGCDEPALRTEGGVSVPTFGAGADHLPHRVHQTPLCPGSHPLPLISGPGPSGVDGAGWLAPDGGGTRGYQHPPTGAPPLTLTSCLILVPADAPMQVTSGGVPPRTAWRCGAVPAPRGSPAGGRHRRPRQRAQSLT